MIGQGETETYRPMPCERRHTETRGGETYPATPYLRRMTVEHGWRGELIRDEGGDPEVIVTVRVGPVWTDAVAIESEHRCVAIRMRTHDGDGLILPTELDGSGAVWRRDGRCVDVLAELLDELPDPIGGGR